MECMFIDLLGLEQNELEWYQMLVRVVIVFVYAITIIRLTGMRTFGTKSAFDIVVSITLGGMLGRCIMGHYPFFSSLVAATGLVCLHRLVSFVSSRNRTIAKLTAGEPVLLSRDGKKQMEELRKYEITDRELNTALHENGVENLTDTKSVWLEPDGKISVIPQKNQ